MQNATVSQLSAYASLDPTSIPFPRPTVYPYVSATQSGLCNVYIPNDSTLSRSVSPPFSVNQGKSLELKWWYDTQEQLLSSGGRDT